jgi:colanic acid/amylovoran biosynthesis glycosyltransferase
LKQLKCIQLFESYGENYQPYLLPVMETLKDVDRLKVSILSFNNSSKVDYSMPSFQIRRFIEKLYALWNKSKLNYFEIHCLHKKTDIVHVQQSYLFSKVLGLIQLPKNKRPKIVFTLRGGDTYVKPWYSEKWKDFYFNFGNQIDAFVVMSAHQKNYLHEKWKIDLKRIHVIPISFGVPFDIAPKSPNKNIMKIVSAFRMCWEKNIEGNLRVIKSLKEKGISVQYDIYGDGSDLGQLYYLIDKYTLQNVVFIHGRVSNTRLKEALLKSDFFLQLSHSESLGMSVIEAQTLGLPAVVSNSDGLPGVIIHEKTGYCVYPYDIEQAATKLEKLWKDPVLYQSFSLAAIKFSQEHYSIKQEVDKLTSLYQNLKAN